MKKTVFSILLVLPVFLILVISLIGRVYSDFNFVRVENVRIYDENDNPLERDNVLHVQRGNETRVKVKILPELATNKNYSFVSSDESVCEVRITDEGVFVCGKSYGTALITVKTESDNKTAVIGVSVRDDFVSGVTLSAEEISIGVGEEKTFSAVVMPETALDKRVSWLVPDEYKDILSVDSDGTVKGLSEGDGEVVVRTTDGGYEANCRVKVVGVTPIYFDKPGGTPDLWEITESVFDLRVYLRINAEGVTADDVKFSVESGGKRATIDRATGVVSFVESGIVVVKAYVGDEDNPRYFATVSLYYSQKS